MEANSACRLTSYTHTYTYTHIYIGLHAIDQIKSNQITMRVLSPMWEVALVKSILRAELLICVAKCLMSFNVTSRTVNQSYSSISSWVFLTCAFLNLSIIDLLGHSIVTHLFYLLLPVLLPLLHHIQHSLLLQFAPNIHIPHSIHSGNPLYTP